MALVNIKDDAPVPKQESVIPTPKEYRGIDIDSSEIPLKTLITHIRGYRQIVTYYSQLLNRDNETSAHRINGSAVYQGYKKIIDLEFKISEPLPDKPDYEAASREMDITGNATVYPGLIPNTGDEFTMRLRGGRLGVFVVNDNIQELSIFRNKCYSFEFRFKSYAVDSYMSALESKVVQSYYFIRDNLDTGLNPIITDTSYKTYMELLDQEKQLPIEYMNRFYSKEVNCPLLPDQDYRIYDPFHTRFTMAVFGEIKHGVFHSVMSLNVTSNIDYPILTIHDAILDFTPVNLDDIMIKNSIQPRVNFMNNPSLLGTRYIPAPFLIYPQHYAPSIYSYWATKGTGGCECDYRPDPGISLNPGKRRPTKIRRSIGMLFDGGDEEPEFTFDKNDDYKPVTVDNYYIFSEDFYGMDREKCSNVERMTLDMLDGKMIESEELLRIIKASAHWPSLERYYYQPFLHAMINYALRSLD